MKTTLAALAATTLLACTTTPAVADEISFRDGDGISVGAAVVDPRGDITWAHGTPVAGGAGSDILTLEYGVAAGSNRLAVTMRVADLNRRTEAGGWYRLNIASGDQDRYRVYLGDRPDRSWVENLRTGYVKPCGTATRSYIKDTITWTLPARCLPHVKSVSVSGLSIWHGTGDTELGSDTTAPAMAVPLR